MKDNKGVTLASLTVYIIVLIISLVVLTFVSANFTSQISDVIDKGKISNEFIKLESFIISDLKSSKNIVEYSDDFVRFDNDIRYSIKYLDTASGKDKQVRQYEIYRNGVLISENLLDAKFDYDVQNKAFILKIRYLYGKEPIEKKQTFFIGRGY